MAPTSTKTKAASKKTSTTSAASKRASSTAPTRTGQGKKKESRPVTLNGKPAKNRHFLLDRRLYQKALSKCRKDGLALSDVLRLGLEKYGEGAPENEGRDSAARLLPPDAMKSLKEVWDSGDSERISHYLAALHRGGWPMQAIADSIVSSRAMTKMSRQAVSLRVVKVPEELRKDIPEVPALGPRRTNVSPRKGKKGPPKPAKRKALDTPHDLSFRVADEDYAKAASRAKHEGAMMSGVLDVVLANYINGDYDEELTARHG